MSVRRVGLLSYQCETCWYAFRVPPDTHTPPVCPACIYYEGMQLTKPHRFRAALYRLWKTIKEKLWT